MVAPYLVRARPAAAGAGHLIATNSPFVARAETGAGFLLLAIGTAIPTIIAATMLVHAYTNDGVRLSFNGRQWRTRHDEHALRFVR